MRRPRSPRQGNPPRRHGRIHRGRSVHTEEIGHQEEAKVELPQIHPVVCDRWCGNRRERERRRIRIGA
ncbi:hypothetical protein RHGRI_019780 [Rhododendron griersonianum]|uniref:Uncharacterized protein n=1 Tax=Rhododendron griersonianum TaxID=479676 RepID=A0AAV6JLA5_9ERIC|nr:hypothetical protein RHGRI_019780 [Rhododendron griersonianum]